MQWRRTREDTIRFSCATVNGDQANIAKLKARMKWTAFASSGLCKVPRNLLSTTLFSVGRRLEIAIKGYRTACAAEPKRRDLELDGSAQRLFSGGRGLPQVGITQESCAFVKSKNTMIRAKTVDDKQISSLVRSTRPGQVVLSR